MATSTWHSLSFLGRLPEPARGALLRLGTPKALQAGELLVRQGEMGRTAYLVLSGRVSVTLTVENGTESLLGIRYPGDLVGEMAMLSAGIRSATVVARDRSTVLVLYPESFYAYLTKYPEAALALNGMTGDRLIQANAYRADAAGYEIEVRLARALLYQARRMLRRQGGLFIVELKQSELAMLIGAKEGTVQKALNGPALRNLVRCRRGRVLLLDVTGLAGLAEMDVPSELTQPAN
jgi:CRP/FNR family cyclic AMP-dependent transcriptional regulator